MDHKKIKLIWVIDSLGHGGAEHLAVPILGSLDPEKFDIRICALQNRNGSPIAKELEALGFIVDTLDIRLLRDPANIPKLVRYFRLNKPDLVHTQLQFSDTLGTLAAKITGTPSVSTQHTIEGFPPKSKGARRQKIAWAVLRKFANRVIAVSEKTKEYHLHTGKLNPSRTLTLYNGIQINRFSSPPANARGETRKIFNIPANNFVITTVAVLRAPKGISNMVAAMAQLQKKHQNINYLIVGDGEDRLAIEKQITDLGLGQMVVLAGQCTIIPKILAASDLFVLPTLTDALPTVLFEAQAAGVPIIATSVGGIPEIITDGHDGRLVPPADVIALVTAVEEIISNPAIGERFARNGRETVESRFNINVQIQKLTQLYQEVIDEHR